MYMCLTFIFYNLVRFRTDVLTFSNRCITNVLMINQSLTADLQSVTHAVDCVQFLYCDEHQAAVDEVSHAPIHVNRMINK